MPLTEAPGAGRLVDVGDTRLHVVEKSLEGLPLICLHGGPGFDHWSFGDYLDPLVPDLRLILVDQRGHGMSDPVPEETLTVKDMAEDVGVLAEALELEEYAVLGHSFGGFVALRHAVERPAGPAGLILVGTTASISTVPSAAERVLYLPVELRERALAPPDPSGASAEDLRRTLEAHAPVFFADLEDPRCGDWLRKMAPAVFQPAALAKFRRTGVDHELVDRLGEVRARTLVTVGRHDRACPLESAETIASGVPGARLVVFERSGHLPFVEEQAVFLDTVRDFLLGRG